jgi:hypothetical protein
MYQDKTPDGMYMSNKKPTPGNNDLPEDPQAEAIVAEAVELAATVLKIAAEYNVRHISPNELAEMSRRLYYAGALGLAEHALLTHQPHLLDHMDPEAGRYRQLALRPDQPRDLLAEWQEHLDLLTSTHADPAAIALTASVVELLESFQPLEDEET